MRPGGHGCRLGNAGLLRLAKGEQGQLQLNAGICALAHLIQRIAQHLHRAHSHVRRHIFRRLLVPRLFFGACAHQKLLPAGHAGQ